MTTNLFRKFLPWAAALAVLIPVTPSMLGADFLPPDAPALKPHLQ